MKFRLSVLLCGAWALGAYFTTADSSYGYWLDDYVGALVMGWAVIFLGIYGIWWVIEAPDVKVKLPTLPKWAIYVLGFLGIGVAMSLPDFLMR
jgi:hypothetical protein